MRLFISHASEDKADFVRPLAEALRQDYEVWYDEYELTVGDSLRQKIDEGLGSCDFGVVVLSKAFFQKQWTQAELDGLFALETQSRKIILPIWKGVKKDDVLSYSPILAGRLAALAEGGIPDVIRQIRLAVDNSERKRQMTLVDDAETRFRELGESMDAKRASSEMLCTSQGYQLVLDAFQDLRNSLESTLKRIQSQTLTFEFKRTSNAIAVIGPFRVSVGLSIQQLTTNSAASSFLVVKYFLIGSESPGDETVELQHDEFRPFCDRNGMVFWIDATTKHTVAMKALERHIILQLRERMSAGHNQNGPTGGK